MKEGRNIFFIGLILHFKSSLRLIIKINLWKTKIIAIEVDLEFYYYTNKTEISYEYWKEVSIYDIM